MSNLLLDEQLEILRRIAERGLRLSQCFSGGPVMIPGVEGTHTHLDLWQHMLDEIDRAQKWYSRGA